MITQGTPAQVRDHVRRLMEIWRPGGGHVFQQVHNLMADVPPANIVAMYDAVNA
jgi:uroporphyrinogen decarboxylase